MLMNWCAGESPLGLAVLDRPIEPTRRSEAGQLENGAHRRLHIACRFGMSITHRHPD